MKLEIKLILSYPILKVLLLNIYYHILKLKFFFIFHLLEEFFQYFAELLDNNNNEDNDNEKVANNIRNNNNDSCIEPTTSVNYINLQNFIFSCDNCPEHINILKKFIKRYIFIMV